MPNTRDYLTATDYFKYITCPHWPYYDRFATPEEAEAKRPFSDSEKRRMDDGVAHEKDVFEDYAKDHEMLEMERVIDPEDAFAYTLQAMKEGAEYIYQGALLHEDWFGRPDILKRVPGVSELGNWHYIPYDIKSSHRLKPEHMFQLTFYSVLLKHIQGVFPEKAVVINMEKEELAFDPSELLHDFNDVTDKIQAIRKGEKPLPILRKSCFDTSPWGAVCEKYAVATNDIARLFKVDIRKLAALRELGINSVEQVAELDPDEYAGQGWGLTRHALEAMKYQALSLRDNKVFIRKPCTFQETPCEIHFDIESDLPNDADYLYGFIVRENGEDKHIKFLAERPEDERLMWAEFMKWIETLPPDYLVYHYAPHELIRLQLLRQRHGGSKWLDLFQSRMIDLKVPATGNIVYPLHFYSLKKICNFLGFFWKSDLKSGGESIDRFESWCETGDRAILDDIVLYNEYDVRATAFLKDWMVKYAGEVGEYGEPWEWGSSQ